MRISLLDSIMLKLIFFLSASIIFTIIANIKYSSIRYLQSNGKDKLKGIFNLYFVLRI